MSLLRRPGAVHARTALRCREPELHEPRRGRSSPRCGQPGCRHRRRAGYGADFDGGRVPHDGNADGVAVADRGAFEKGAPRVIGPTPPADARADGSAYSGADAGTTAADHPCTAGTDTAADGRRRRPCGRRRYRVMRIEWRRSDRQRARRHSRHRLHPRRQRLRRRDRPTICRLLQPELGTPQGTHESGDRQPRFPRLREAPGYLRVLRVAKPPRCSPAARRGATAGTATTPAPGTSSCSTVSAPPAIRRAT